MSDVFKSNINRIIQYTLNNVTFDVYDPRPTSTMSQAGCYGSIHNDIISTAVYRTLTDYTLEVRHVYHDRVLLFSHRSATLFNA